MEKKSKQVLFFLLFLAVSLMAGYFGSQLSGNSTVQTYSQLYKPDFFPPSWVFGPVWTILYILMGLSAYLIWRTKKDIKTPLILFFAQLVLNLFWPAIFFGLHQYFWSFIEILMLLIMIIITIFSFDKKSKTAAYLLIPYLFWVSFATILNYIIFRTN